MAIENRRASCRVLLLHNLDPSWSSRETAEVRAAVRLLLDGLRGDGYRVHEVPLCDGDLAGALAPFDPQAHIVFNWCEELPGCLRGDVRVTQVLEQLGFNYTGSPSEVLALSWDKAAVKQRLIAAGVPTPRWRVGEDHHLDSWQGFPAIVKPAFEHCSVGLDREAVVLDAAALGRRVRHVRETFRQPALVEDFIDGREFHLTLWGNGRIHALPPAEMDFSAFNDVRDRLCTYDSKFSPGSLHYEGIELRVPAVLTAEEHAALVRTAVQAYRVVGCRDYARLDLRQQGGIFYVLDINPNPDISPDTSLALAAEAAGMSYRGFIRRLLELAAARQPSQPCIREIVP
jgi:D-alanine-D-alanine ligase